MAGLDVLASARADDRLRAIPFIVLTGDPSMEEAARTRGLSADAFLMKPVKVEDLATAVRAALG
jgi:CheY-like chemotaxis protein